MSYNQGISKETILKGGSYIWKNRGRSVFLYVLRGLGFVYRQKEFNPIVSERPDIVHKRMLYLQLKKDQVRVREEREERGSSSLLKEGHHRCITQLGVLKGSELLLVSGLREEDQKQDYHADMDGNNFEIYYRKMIPLFAAEAAKLGRPAVLLCDNAPYHNAPLRKPPTSTSSRADIISFLTEHGVKFFPKQTKEILYDLAGIFIESNGGREAFTVYKFDEYAKSHGVTVLRLPQYHCFFNPVELLWAQLKQHLRKIGKPEDSVELVRSRAKAFLESFPATSADKLFLHTQKLETDLREMMEEEDMTDYDEVFDLNYDVDEAGNLYNIQIDSDDEDAMVDEEIETICPTDCSVSSDDDFNVFSDTEDYDF
ncbi:Protein CBG01161 [Caenorhabditis briggsae]|uniref:Protein CBG01161 n=1 Tax=Caenorhabditis briggsae TaxID=6238 RepID=A8WPQ3_CAEBR|nr:Protein CBG01161 [Caenorhabditis briggsae]CAP22460.1 Protein CBG01161 [Caenorhabditis briggsae]